MAPHSNVRRALLLALACAALWSRNSDHSEVGFLAGPGGPPPQRTQPRAQRTPPLRGAGGGGGRECGAGDGGELHR